MADARKRGPKEDTTLLRIARNVGFNARVEPMWHTFERLRERVGWFEKWRLKKRFRRIVMLINEHFQDNRIKAGGWDRVPGKCVCNLRVAKFGLVADLRSYFGAKVEPEKAAAWNHIGGLNETNGIAIPVEFAEPFVITPARGEKPISVISSLRLREELKQVNAETNIEEKFALEKITKIDFLDAKDKEIAVFESRYATFGDFWPKFAYFLLKKLSDKSAENTLPIQFA